MLIVARHSQFVAPTQHAYQARMCARVAGAPVVAHVVDAMMKKRMGGTMITQQQWPSAAGFSGS